MSLPILKSLDSLSQGFFFDYFCTELHYIYIILSLFFTSIVYAGNADSTLNKFHYQLNDNLFSYHSLPELGSSVLILDNNVGFNSNFNSFLFYKKSFSEDIYKAPYTNLFFTSGAKKEQYINLNHSQSFGNILKYFFNYNRFSTNGFYQNGSKKGTNFNFGLIYSSKNKKYSSKLICDFNKFNYSENGGVLYDTIDFKLIDRSFVDTRLQNANNLYQHRKLTSFNEYLLDSLFGINIKANYNVDYTEKKYRYTDASSMNYIHNEVVDYSSAPIFDSIYENRFINEIGFKFNNTNNSLDVLFGNELINYKQSVLDFNLLNYFLKIKGHSTYEKSFDVDYNADYILNGYNKGNYNFGFKALKKVKEINLNFDFYTKKYSAKFWQENYYSDIYKWSNVFNSIKETSLELSTNFLDYDLSLNGGAKLINNFVYLSKDFLPKQSSNPTKIYFLEISKRFNYKKLHYFTKQRLQSVEGEGVELPLLSSFNSFYYESFIINKALLFRIGVDLYYRSEYYGMGYNPELRSFYYQNNVKTGNYPVVDFFVASKIKNGKVFFKVTHLNADYTGNNYYFVPHYALSGRAYRIGVSWTFWN